MARAVSCAVIMGRSAGVFPAAMLAFAVACYAPAYAPDQPCGEDGQCPSDLRCDPATLTCVEDLAPAVELASIDAGWRHGCGIAPDGALYCWGDHVRGALGVGQIEAPLEVPTRVVGDPGWQSVSVGDTATCAIRTDGSLWCWGSSLTTGFPDDEWEPARVDDRTWTAVSAGAGGFCGITDGEVWCRWNDVTTLVRQDAPGVTFSSVAVAGNRACAIAASG